MIVVNDRILNHMDVIWKYFCDHPYEKITIRMLAEKLEIKKSTINSSVYRLYISGKINKAERGVYMINPPLPKGQSTLGEVAIELDSGVSR